jgi:hypothetical protein
MVMFQVFPKKYRARFSRALTVDIGDFEITAFVKPQAAGEHGGRIAVIVEGFDMSQKVSNFIDG